MLENHLTPTQELTSKGIRPSYHRVKILQYLRKDQSHPTVEDIFSALSPEIPSLSKATVYNTLHTFIEAGLVRELNIHIDAQHYDSMLEEHGHFKCISCGQISNFNLDHSQLVIKDLQGFQIQKRDVYFSGLCPVCQSKTKLKENNGQK